VSRTDPISIVEACYSLEHSSQDWLTSLTTCAARVFGAGQGALGLLYDLAVRPDWVEPLGVARSPDMPVALAEQFPIPPARSEAVLQLQRLLGATGIFTSRHLTSGARPSAEVLAAHGVADAVAIVALDPTERGCALVIPIRAGENSPRTRYIWKRIAAHIAAGYRLRTALTTSLAAGADPVSQAEAVLSASGKIEHASGDARSNAARDALRNCLVRIHAARSSERRDPKAALDLWRAMVAGRWSVVEHFERGGRRYYLACRNDPSLPPVRALTRREQQVISYAAVGHSNKLIAYAMGLSISTVATHLEGARRKLGSKISLAAIRELSIRQM
jgi:DNA-binding CsgD family transcriptional regulator